MNSLAWVLLVLAVQWTALLGYPRRVNNGRLLTRPIRRRVRWLANGLVCRIAQWFVCAVAFFAIDWYWLYAVSFSLLYVDDILTGDDDEWRRFREHVRNAVKWLMALPARPEGQVAS